MLAVGQIYGKINKLITSFQTKTIVEIHFFIINDF